MTQDEDLARAIRKGWRSAAIDERDQLMLDYVEKLTLRAPTVSPADLDVLRAAGFDDTAILQINMIASFFNYINRIADGLGVGRE